MQPHREIRRRSDFDVHLHLHHHRRLRIAADPLHSPEPELTLLLERLRLETA